MRAFNYEQTHSWWENYSLPLDERGFPGHPEQGQFVLRFSTEAKTSRLVFLAETLVDALGPWENALLWITDSGVWPSSENLHLFYRLRQSYGEMRLLEEAPGHLFLGYEKADLSSFLQVVLPNGWDVSVATSHNYARLFVSHDSWGYVCAAEEAGLAECRTAFAAEDLILG